MPQLHLELSPTAGLAVPACWTWPPPDTSTEVGLHDLDDFQQGRCAVCGKVSAKLVIDHSHVTSRVRGYLCESCNSGEGAKKRRKSAVMSLYRSRSAADIIGLRMTYRQARLERPRLPVAPPTELTLFAPPVDVEETTSGVAAVTGSDRIWWDVEEYPGRWPGERKGHYFARVMPGWEFGPAPTDYGTVDGVPVDVDGRRIEFRAPYLCESCRSAYVFPAPRVSAGG